MLQTLAAVALAAGGAWSGWQSVAPVDVGRVASVQAVRFTLPPEVDPSADLRIIDERGSEMPYVVDPDAHRAAPQAPERLPLSDVAFVPGAYTQAIVDLGSDGRLHEAVDIEAPGTLFFARVGIESSDDRRTWGRLRDDAYIYRVAPDRKGNTIVSFPATHARWLRLRILDPRTRFPIDGISAANAPAQKSDAFVALPAGFSPSKGNGSIQRWTANFAQPVAASAVRFGGGDGAFERAVTVEGSADGETWHEIASGSIARFARGTPQTTFAFEEERLPHWRVALDNANDRPVTGLWPQLLKRPHDVLFEALPARSYRLLSGNAWAAQPTYDLAARLEHENWSAMPATLGPLAPNGAYADNRPFLERFPFVLPAVFIAAALGLLVFALRVVRSAQSATVANGEPPAA